MFDGIKSNTPEDKAAIAVQFGQMLKTERLRKGVGRDTIGKLLDMAPQYLLLIERGDKPPLNEKRIHQLAEYFQIDPDPLLELSTAYHGEIAVVTSILSASGKRLLFRLSRQTELPDKVAKELLRVLDKYESGHKHPASSQQQPLALSSEEKIAA
jgi:transcriptional regulator with XRE-family HTH domain